MTHTYNYINTNNSNSNKLRFRVKANKQYHHPRKSHMVSAMTV